MYFGIRGVCTLFIVTHTPQMHLIPQWLYQLRCRPSLPKLLKCRYHDAIRLKFMLPPQPVCTPIQLCISLEDAIGSYSNLPHCLRLPVKVWPSLAVDQPMEHELHRRDVSTLHHNTHSFTTSITRARAWSFILVLSIPGHLLVLTLVHLFLSLDLFPLAALLSDIANHLYTPWSTFIWLLTNPNCLLLTAFSVFIHLSAHLISNMCSTKSFLMSPNCKSLPCFLISSTKG